MYLCPLDAILSYYTTELSNTTGLSVNMRLYSSLRYEDKGKKCVGLIDLADQLFDISLI